MPKALVIATIIRCLIGTNVQGYAEGLGAYYADGVMQRVCEHRTNEGWNDLDCSHECLVSGIEPEHVGEWWLVQVPGASYHLCHVVDCGAESDLPTLRERGEVVEIPYWLAMEAGWDGYQEGVRIWRLTDR